MTRRKSRRVRVAFNRVTRAEARRSGYISAHSLRYAIYSAVSHGALVQRSLEEREALARVWG